jgi:hypothetical protein
MDIISSTLLASKSQEVRGWHFVAGEAPTSGTLTITQGRNTKDFATYAVRLIPGVPGRARGFRLVKVAGGTDDAADHYDVLIDSTGHDSCECRGFLRHGNCKHTDACRGLIVELCPTCAGHGYVPTADLTAETCPTCQSPAPISSASAVPPFDAA